MSIHLTKGTSRTRLLGVALAAIAMLCACAGGAPGQSISSHDKMVDVERLFESFDPNKIRVGLDTKVLSEWLYPEDEGVLFAKLFATEPCRTILWRRKKTDVVARMVVSETDVERVSNPVELASVLEVREAVLRLERKGANGRWVEEESLAIGTPSQRLGVLTSITEDAVWYAAEEVGIFARCVGEPRNFLVEGTPVTCSGCSDVDLAVVARPFHGWTYELPTVAEERCAELVQVTPKKQHIERRIEQERAGGFFWRRRSQRLSPALYRSEAKCRDARHGLVR